MATTTREASPRQYRFGTSGFRPLLLVPLMCLFAVAGCKGSSSHPATETWDVSIYGSQLSSGQGTYVFQAGGTWTGTWVVGYLGSYAGDVTCPIDVGKWSVDASGYLEGSGSGTASNPSSPTGHEKSHFILDVYGIVNSDGSASGTWSIYFSDWQLSLSGTWTATRRGNAVFILVGGQVADASAIGDLGRPATDTAPHGKLLWEWVSPSLKLSSPTLSLTEDRVLVVGSLSENQTKAYSLASDGRFMWEYLGPGKCTDTCWASYLFPLSVARSRAIFLVDNNSDAFVALNPDGQLLWLKRAKDFTSRSVAPMGAGDGAVFGAMSNTTHVDGLSLVDGASLWLSPTSVRDVHHARLALSRDGLLVSAADGAALDVFSGASGVKLWSEPLSAAPTGLALDATNVYLAFSKQATLIARDLQGKLIWTGALTGEIGSPVINSAGNIVVLAKTEVQGGSLYEVSSSTGEVVRSVPLQVAGQVVVPCVSLNNGEYPSPVVISSGDVLFIGEDGAPYVVGQAGYVRRVMAAPVVASAQVADMCSTPVVDSRGILYYRILNRLYAVDTGIGAGLASTPWPKQWHDNQNSSNSGGSGSGTPGSSTDGGTLSPPDGSEAPISIDASGSGGAGGMGGQLANDGSGGNSSSDSGGNSTGGSGGNSTGDSGGNSTGGSGGNSSGDSGGNSTGGSPGSGGSPDGGGTAAGGATGAGGTPVSDNPPGYYMTKDWGVTSVDWHGCVWTGSDSTVAGSDTSIIPQDFTAAAKEGGPYHVSGTVFNDDNAVALLGFNLNEATTGSSTQCVYNEAAVTSAGPPAATVPRSATGIAVNWSVAKIPPTSFRIQIQGVDGATNASHRWCATITETAGPSFFPFSHFSTQCGGLTSVPPAPGAPYAGEPIDAVLFLVPGTVAGKAPFDFTIVGFAPGNSKADAPGVATCGTQTGTLGSTTASKDASMARAKVSGTDCKQYVVQNNNWGNPTGSTQVINFTGTSFTIASSSGSSAGQGVPASFPSAFIGGNGNIAGGTYSTWQDSGLPRQVSAISSVWTTFGWSGGSGGKDFNATYDIWFSKSTPTAGAYNDAISGFLMIWLYKPAQGLGTLPGFPSQLRCGASTPP